MFLDFKEISQKVRFRPLLDWLCIPYTETEAELKGEGFIVNKEKNLYFNPLGEDKGSVINFLSVQKTLPLREAALALKKQFLTQSEPKKDFPELTLKYGKAVAELGISEETAALLGIGIPQGKSIMAGKVAFTCHAKDDTPLGYVGLKDGQWFYPKGFPATQHLYNLNRVKGQNIILASSPLIVAKSVQEGFQAAGLFHSSLSDTQIDLLKGIKCVYLIHNKPENLVIRLAKRFYVKYS